MEATTLDIRGILRRVTVGNFHGARRLLAEHKPGGRGLPPDLADCQKRCIQNVSKNQPVKIQAVVSYLKEK